MRQRCGQDERKHLRDRVSPPRTTPGTQSNYRGNCQSPLSADLDYLAPRGPLPGTRPGRVRKVEANTHRAYDPAASKPRLSRRTADRSSQPSMRPGAGGGGIFDPARHTGGDPCCKPHISSRPKFLARGGTHFFSSVSQLVTSTTGAVLSVMESTTRNLASRATSYASVEMEWRMPAVNNGLAAPICTASPDV
jgi:hypothetical protein